MMATRMTQQEVARALGISQGRVMQLEQSAFRKLRRNPQARALLELCRFKSDVTNVTKSGNVRVRRRAEGHRNG